MGISEHSKEHRRLGIEPKNSVQHAENNGANSAAAAAINTAAIQSALDAANAAGGGIVSLTTPGTYLINDSLVIFSNTHLHVGEGVEIKLADGSSAADVLHIGTMLVNRAHRDLWMNGTDPNVPGANPVVGTITSLAFPRPASSASNVVTMIVPASDPIIDTVSVGDYINVLWCGAKGYGGVHRVLSKTGTGPYTLTYRPTKTPVVASVTQGFRKSVGRSATFNGTVNVTNVNCITGSGATGTLDLKVGMRLTSVTAGWTNLTGPIITAVNPGGVAKTLTLDSNPGSYSGTPTDVKFIYPLRYQKADVNIKISGGGKFNYNRANNTTTLAGTAINTAQCSGAFLGGIHNLQVEDVEFINTGGRGMCVYALNGHSRIDNVNNDYTQVGIQVLGPINGLIISNWKSREANDDVIAIMDKESESFTNEHYSFGDIDIEIDGVDGATTGASVLTLYCMSDKFYMNAKAKTIRGSADGVYTLYGVKIGGGSVNNDYGKWDSVILEDIMVSALVNEIVAQSCRIEKLEIRGYKHNRQTYGTGPAVQPNILFGATAYISQLIFDGIEFPVDYAPATFQHMISIATPLNELILRNVNMNPGQSKYGTVTNTALTVTGLETTEGLEVGMEVSGTNIPVGAYISTIDSDTQITWAGAGGATGTTTGFVTFRASGNLNNGLVNISAAIKSMIVENFVSHGVTPIYIPAAGVIESLTVKNVYAENRAQRVGKWLIDLNGGTLRTLWIDSIVTDYMSALINLRTSGVITAAHLGGHRTITAGSGVTFATLTSGTINPKTPNIPLDAANAAVVAAAGNMFYNTNAAVGTLGQAGPVVYDTVRAKWVLMANTTLTS